VAVPRDLAGHRHPHFEDSHIEVVGPRPARLQLQDREGHAQLVVEVLAAAQDPPARDAEDVREQVLRRRLAGAPRDAHDGPAPRVDDAAREQLQRLDDVLDQEQAVEVGPQRLVAADALGAGHGRDRAAPERFGDEAVRVGEGGGREAVPAVVLGREREEELAPGGRPRVDRKALYFLVKERAASLCCGPHQDVGSPDFHARSLPPAHRIRVRKPTRSGERAGRFRSSRPAPRRRRPGGPSEAPRPASRRFLGKRVRLFCAPRASGANVRGSRRFSVSSPLRGGPRRARD
jgi:hypothetical protein